MKIIILGTSQVGCSLAADLASEANDITVVDTDASALQSLRDHLDIQTIAGHAAYPEVLERAGAEDADMIVAVTNSDEVNMIACQIAWKLFHTPTKIARIRASEYLVHKEIFHDNSMPIDVLISPEQTVTEYVQRLIEFPSALQVLDFAGGRVQLVAVRSYFGGPLVGHEIRTLNEHMPGVPTRVAAIFRRGTPITPEGHTVIEPGDEIFFIAPKQHIRAVLAEMRRLDKPTRNVLLAGGGNIGLRLAKALERNYQVKIIESDSNRSRFISQQLSRSIVLWGDAADEELLKEENIEGTDVFCALTNDDETNILSSMLAKRLGASKVMALINRPAYVDLVQSGTIDIAISPQQTTLGNLLAHVRRGDVVQVHSLRRGAAEAIEAIAHGDRKSSRVVGRRVDEIKLPAGATIGTIVRKDEVIMAHHDTVIEDGDHVILFLQEKERVPEVERLFQVSVTFI